MQSITDSNLKNLVRAVVRNVPVLDGLRAGRPTRMRLQGILLESRVPYLYDLARSRGQVDGVFIHVPKTAGLSLVTALRVPYLDEVLDVRKRFCQRGLVTFGHQKYATLREMGLIDDAFDARAFKFSFVRNPFDRAVSLYSYLKGWRVPTGQSFSEFCLRFESGDIEPIGAFNARGLSQCNPQARWLEGVEVDYLGRLESIAPDTEEICSRLNIVPPELPHVNRSKRKDPREMFDERSLAAVKDYFSEDFERFGYSREL